MFKLYLAVRAALCGEGYAVGLHFLRACLRPLLYASVLLGRAQAVSTALLEKNRAVRLNSSMTALFQSAFVVFLLPQVLRTLRLLSEDAFSVFQPHCSKKIR